MSTQNYTVVSPHNQPHPQSIPAPNIQEYNASFAATGQVFSIRKHTDANGVVWMSIKAYSRFEQIPFAEVSR